MGKGSNTTTTQQQQTYNPAGGPQIQSALTQAQNAAQLPFNIPQAPVAGFSQDQQSAFGNINNAQGMAQPYINQAQQYFSPQGAQQFFNPYASAVTAQMNNIFGQQQQQNTSNLVQSAGGVGADRIAVGQGNLANQQGLAAGQTFANLYGQAAQQAQSAGYGTAALGSQAQNAALQGSQAQLASGGLQQQLQQAQLNSPYQQQLAQAAFPYQQAQFLAGITGSLAPGLGGTTSGTGSTTGPAPSMLSQILGLGTAGVGAAGSMGAFGGGSGGKGSGGVGSYGQASNATGYGAGTGGLSFPMFARGGGIGFDEGGATSSPFDLPPNFNDKPINVAEHSIIPAVQTPAIRPQVPQLNLTPPAPAAQSGPGLADIAKIAMMFVNRGGRVNPYARGGVAGFADGGTPMEDAQWPVGPIGGPSDVINPDEPYRMPDAAAVADWRRGADASMADGTSATSFKPAFPPPSGSHGRSVGEPTVEQPADAPQDVSARSRSPVAPQPYASAGQQDVPAGKRDRFIDSPWAALMAAGLGIAGGTSPFAAVNIGQGGLQGLKTLQEQRSSGQKDETIAQATRRLDLEAKHHEDQYSRLTMGQQQAAEIADRPYNELTAAQKVASQKGRYTPAGSVITEDGGVHPLVLETGSGAVIDAVTGEKPKPTDKLTQKGEKPVVSDEDAKAVAQRYVKTGDRTQLQGLGVSGAARQRVNHYIGEVQKELGVSDEDLGTRVAEFEGRKAGQRSLGTMESRMGASAFEAEGAIKLARGVIERLPRTSFLPFNKLAQGYSDQTLNPDQTELYGRTQAIINTYAAVMSRGANITTDSSRTHAQALLNTAGDPATYNRMLDTMLQEIDMAKHSPERMRDFYRKQFGHQSVGADSGAQPSAPAGGSGGGRTVMRQGTVNSGPNAGKKVIEYSDGTREYQ